MAQVAQGFGRATVGIFPVSAVSSREARTSSQVDGEAKR